MSTHFSVQRHAIDDADAAELAQMEARRGSAAASEQNPISCNICNRSYARLDHLARHLRTHTKEKPFTCDICHKNFSRIDVLKRHTENHASEKPTKRPRTSSQPTAHRVSRACKACAEAKLKCSESHPCERCTSKGINCDLDSSTRQDPFNTGPGQSLDLAQYEHTDGFCLPHGDEVALQQMPTPSTLPNAQAGSNTMSFTPQNLDIESSRSFHDLMMVDFMCNVMNQGPFDPHLSGRNMGTLPDILDFAFDDAFDFSSAELFTPHLENDRPTANVGSGTATPSIHRLASLGQQAFKDSMWLWTPARGDSSTAEQENLSLPTPELIPEETIEIMYHLSLASRDRVLSLILRTCEPSAQRQVVSCFPSADMLSKLLSNFITYHSHQFAPWIHVATLDLNQDREVFLLALIASGATNSPYPNVRKLGYAMQEALRSSIPESFENDNRNTRDLRLLQAYALQLQIGLWSGNRRKMEIAESFAFPLITMMRRGGRFRQKMLAEVAPLAGDDFQARETKWKEWAQHESFKRLAYHIFLTDTGSSFSLMSQPLMSYAEVCVDLPCSQDLWEARTVQEWSEKYLTRNKMESEQMPNLRSILEDLSQMTRIQSSIDVQMSLAVVVSTVWSRVWQCLQMKNLSNYQLNGSGGSNMLTVNTYYQELVHAAKNVSLRSSDWSGGLGPYAELLLELCMLHLHVSLEAVQLLAGKDGEEEARKVVPTLRRWVESAESRQAIFHAGRVLSAARKFPFGHLRDHSAVAVYHASLAMWAYAVLSETPLRTSTTSIEQQRRFPNQQEAQRVLLDSMDGPELQRFLVLGIGQPAIGRNEEDWLLPATGNNYVLLSDTLTAMKSIANLLASKNGDEQSRPPMVANLNKLILALGKAAAEMKKKGS